ncbi:MAG: FtsX-like permease family protein [Pseudomonadota bacterium]
MKATLLILAGKEFLRSLKWGNFLWLIIFLWLILSFALLMKGSSEGLKNQFVDLLLGRLDQHGIQIWVRPDPFRDRFQRFLDEWVLAQVKELEDGIPGITIHPYRLVDKTMLALPDKVWQYDKTDPFDIGFRGMAVYEEDPLWRTLAGDTPADGLVLILNRSLLKDRFDYSAYLKMVKTFLPEPLFKKLPTTATAFFSEHFQGSLWLAISGSQKREWLPVQIIWTDRIPVPEKFAYIFPMSTYHALREAGTLANLQVFPEAAPNESRIEEVGLKKRFTIGQVSQFGQCVGSPISWGKLSKPLAEEAVAECAENAGLRREDYQHSISQITVNDKVSFSRLEEFAFCVDWDAQLPVSRTRVRLIMAPPKPKIWVEACAEQASISQEDYEISVPAGWGDDVIQKQGQNSWHCEELAGQSRLPVDFREYCRANPQGKISKPAYILSLATCEKILPGELELTEEETRQCEENPDWMIHKPATYADQGYLRAFVYIQKRQQLADTVTALNNLSDNPLHLHPLYQDALTRFSTLVEILEALSGPYMWLGIVFVLVLIGVQMATLVSHHRHHYGIFLAKGMSQGQIYLMLFFQTTLATLPATVFAYATIELWIRTWLLEQLMPKAEKFKAVIDVEKLNLLPLGGWDYVQTGFIIFGVVILIAGIALLISGLHPRTMPSDLLKE